MADKKITQFPAATALVGTEELPIVQSGDTKRATVAQLAAAVGVDSTLLEIIRDLIGTVITAGTGITVTVNDGANTVTITSSGVSDGDKGDVIVSAAGTNWQIDAGAVGLAEVITALKDCSLPVSHPAPVVGILVIDQKAPFGYTITEFAAQLSSGTCTARLLINGTPVTGSSTAFTTTEAAGTCTAANVVAAGDTVSIEWTAVSTPVNFSATVKATLS